MRSRGLEPPRVLPHMDLNHARLPIPPRPQVYSIVVPREGLEPSRPRGHRFLRPARLPVPPSRLEISIPFETSCPIPPRGDRPPAEVLTSMAKMFRGRNRFGACSVRREPIDRYEELAFGPDVGTQRSVLGTRPGLHARVGGDQHLFGHIPTVGEHPIARLVQQRLWA